jgi:hypothetical protein
LAAASRAAPAFHEFDNLENNCAGTRRRRRTYVELTRPLVTVRQPSFVRANSRYRRISNQRGLARSYRAIAQSFADEQHQAFVAHAARAFDGLLEPRFAGSKFARAAVPVGLGFRMPRPRVEGNADQCADPGTDGYADNYSNRYA